MNWKQNDNFFLGQFSGGQFSGGQFYRSQWTKAPRYNKCWSLEILQDNSKALAGRCLEEWAVILQISAVTKNKKTPTSHLPHTTITKNDLTLLSPPSVQLVLESWNYSHANNPQKVTHNTYATHYNIKKPPQHCQTKKAPPSQKKKPLIISSYDVNENR